MLESVRLQGSGFKVHPGAGAGTGFCTASECILRTPSACGFNRDLSTFCRLRLLLFLEICGLRSGYTKVTKPKNGCEGTQFSVSTPGLAVSRFVLRRGRVVGLRRGSHYPGAGVGMGFRTASGCVLRTPSACRFNRDLSDHGANLAE